MFVDILDNLNWTKPLKHVKLPQLIIKNIYISLTNRSGFQTQLWTYFSLYGLDLIFFCFLVKGQYHICVQKQRANSQQIGEIEIKSNLNSCYPTRQNNLKHTNTHRGGEWAQRLVCLLCNLRTGFEFWREMRDFFN